MRLSSLLMFAGIKAPHINGIMGFSDHCFAFFYISDWKQYASINGFNSNFTNIYDVRKGFVSGCHLFLTYNSDLYGQQNIPKYTIFQMIQA